MCVSRVPQPNLPPGLVTFMGYRRTRPHCWTVWCTTGPVVSPFSSHWFFVDTVVLRTKVCFKVFEVLLELNTLSFPLYKSVLPFIGLLPFISDLYLDVKIHLGVMVTTKDSVHDPKTTKTCVEPSLDRNVWRVKVLASRRPVSRRRSGDVPSVLL